MFCSSGIKLSHKGFKVSVRFGCNLVTMVTLIVNDFDKTVQIQNITLLSQYGFLWLKYVCIQYNILAYLRNETHSHLLFTQRSVVKQHGLRYSYLKYADKEDCNEVIPQC